MKFHVTSYPDNLESDVFVFRILKSIFNYEFCYGYTIDLSCHYEINIAYFY